MDQHLQIFTYRRCCDLGLYGAQGNPLCFRFSSWNSDVDNVDRLSLAEVLTLVNQQKRLESVIWGKVGMFCRDSREIDVLSTIPYPRAYERVGIPPPPPKGWLVR